MNSKLLLAGSLLALGSFACNGAGSDDADGTGEAWSNLACEDIPAPEDLTASETSVTLRNDAAETVIVYTGPCANSLLDLDGDPVSPGWADWKCEDVPTCTNVPMQLDCHWAPNTENEIPPGGTFVTSWSGLARARIPVPASCGSCESSIAPTSHCALATVPESGPHELSVYFKRAGADVGETAKVTFDYPAASIVLPIPPQ